MMRQGDYTETYLTSEEVAQLQAGGYVVEEIEDGGGLYKKGGAKKSDDEVYAEILRGIDAPVTAENLKFLKAWRQAEGGRASNNPFNTTYKLVSQSRSLTMFL